MRAKYTASCCVCGDQIHIGLLIERMSAGWAHPDCAESWRAFQALRSGESTSYSRRSDWRIGKGPGSYR